MILFQDMPKPLQPNFVLDVEMSELFIQAGLQDRVIQVRREGESEQRGKGESEQGGKGEKEGGREGGRERRRKGGEWEEVKREGGKEGGREGGREEGREEGVALYPGLHCSYLRLQFE